jgi:hypothetical protein
MKLPRLDDYQENQEHNSDIPWDAEALAWREILF